MLFTIFKCSIVKSYRPISALCLPLATPFLKILVSAIKKIHVFRLPIFMHQLSLQVIKRWIKRVITCCAGLAYLERSVILSSHWQQLNHSTLTFICSVQLHQLHCLHPHCWQMLYNHSGPLLHVFIGQIITLKILPVVSNYM